ncbi:MAG: hypothetical protein WBI63_00515 [Coriobacteriia bacterium]
MVSGAPSVFRRVAEQYPQITFVLAHMGGYKCWNDVAAELVGAPEVDRHSGVTSRARS